jgi:hypothetical protein
MAQFDKLIAIWQEQIDSARERIRMMETGEMAVKGTFPPFKDWTLEAIEQERRYIANYDAGIRKLKGQQ